MINEAIKIPVNENTRGTPKNFSLLSLLIGNTLKPWEAVPRGGPALPQTRVCFCLSLAGNAPPYPKRDDESQGP